MARSSGGGSRSGGSRSSSSSSRSSGGSSGYSGGRSYGGTSSGPRISNTPFYGSRTFRYYRDGTAHYVYSDRYLPAMKDPKPRWFLIFFYIPFIFAVFSIFAGSLCFPEKPMTTFSKSNVAVIDTADVFTTTEEQSLHEKLLEFGEKTGVTTQIITVDYDEWTDNGSLENYAYYRYYAQFNDENGWLIVYSEEDDGYGDWSWEGIQGDNTYDTMDVFLDDFNTIFHSQLVLNQVPEVSVAFTTAFDRAIDTFENQHFSVDFAMLPIGFFVLIFISVHGYIMIFAGTKKKYSYKELKEVVASDSDAFNYTKYNFEPTTRQSVSQNQPKPLIECRYCGYKYEMETDNRCPNCHAINS